MWTTINTGFGYWDVLSWFAFFLIGACLAVWFRSQGRGDYKQATDQDEIFYGGNPVPEDGAMITVPASSAYWGFTKALGPFYERLVAFHTGDACEYLGYLLLTTAVLAVALLLL